MTWQEAFAACAGALEKAGVPEPETDAWVLLQYAGGIDRTFWLLHKQEEMPESALTAYREAQAKREKRIPVQHITGEQEFMGLSFKVTGDVLVPRQDTEILAEEALKDLSSGMRVLDLCTGSGCILLSLIALCPGITGTGTDISPRALAVAKENAERLGVSAEFFEGDLFAGAAGPFDMIVSNPPYIRTQEIETLAEEVRLFDPRGALDGGEDGLVFYRRILSECGPYLAEGGHVLLETGWDQAGDVADIMRENGFTQIRILRDLSGKERVVRGRKQHV